MRFRLQTLIYELTWRKCEQFHCRWHVLFIAFSICLYSFIQSHMSYPNRISQSQSCIFTDVGIIKSNPSSLWLERDAAWIRARAAGGFFHARIFNRPPVCYSRMNRELKKRVRKKWKFNREKERISRTRTSVRASAVPIIDTSRQRFISSGM